MDKNQIAVSVFDRRAVDYQEKFMDVSRYHASLDLFCERVSPSGAEVLELACGPGNNTRYLLQKRPDFRILGTDLAPRMVELAQANNPDASFQVMDCRAVSQLNRTFDAVMCGFGLPYLTREEAAQLIADAAGVLQPGGILYLSTMEDDYAKSGIHQSSAGDQLYLYYHQADYLSEALHAHGFSLLHLERMTDDRRPELPFNDLILIAQKQG